MRVVLVSFAADPGDLDRLARSLRQAWPGAAPEFETVDRRSFLNGTMNAPTDDRGVLVALFGADEPRSSAYKFADAIEQHRAVGVMLYPDDAPEYAAMNSGSLFAFPASEPAQRLSTIIATLAQRQLTVADLAREMSLAERSQVDLRTEFSRMHEELNLAAATQKEFLPKALPGIDGLDIGVIFQPAAYVSGDIYGLSRIDDSRVAFFLADAVGHGVPAALLTMIVCRSLHLTETAPEGVREIDPGLAMTRLNADLLAAQQDSPRFATAVAGIIDASTGRVTLAGAGHPPPMVLSRRGMRTVDTDGPLLSVFPGHEYESVEFTLAPGETLVVFSDGFETAFPDDAADADSVRRGTKNYIHEFCALPWPGIAPTGSVRNALDGLQMKLGSQAGSLHQADDLTALAIARLDPANEARRAA